MTQGAPRLVKRYGQNLATGHPITSAPHLSPSTAQLAMPRVPERPLLAAICLTTDCDGLVCSAGEEARSQRLCRTGGKRSRRSTKKLEFGRHFNVIACPVEGVETWGTLPGAKGLCMRSAQRDDEEHTYKHDLNAESNFDAAATSLA